MYLPIEDRPSKPQFLFQDAGLKRPHIMSKWREVQGRVPGCDSFPVLVQNTSFSLLSFHKTRFLADDGLKRPLNASESARRSFFREGGY